MKLMIIFGTRPEVIKLAPVINEARRRAHNLELIVCSTGQHRQMLDQALAVFGITPEVELAVMQENQTLSTLTGRLVESLAATYTVHRPNIVMVQGDTTTAFAAALAAFYQHIPVAHVEAGLRTGDLSSPFPEELNRVMIGRIARWHFAPTKKSAQNLLREGVDPGNVLITGNTVVDAIVTMQNQWNKTGSITDLPELFNARSKVLITAHRRENFGEGLQQICTAISTLCFRHPELGFIFPVHLNPQVRTVVYKMLSNLENLELIEPVDFQTNLKLQSQSCLIITDSGGIQEEAPSFGVPTVVMRGQTERYEGIDAGFATLAGVTADGIVNAAERYLSDTTLTQQLRSKPNPYGDGKASQRIIAHLLGESVEAFCG